MKLKRKLISIAPASGWVAVFAQEKPTKSGWHFSTDLVVLWGVIETDEDSFIVGYAEGDLAEYKGPWADCTECANFLCFAKEEWVQKEPEKYEQMALEYLEREKQKGW